MVDAYLITTIFHIIAAMIAVGGATVVDYLHIVSLRKKKLEKTLVSIYPLISKLINISLGVIYFTGILLVLQNKALLSSPLFITKVCLVLIVTLNGIYLQKSISPHLDKCVIKGTKYCTRSVLNGSAIAGSISIVTWYSIVILSLTKEMGYHFINFVMVYASVILIAITIAYNIEKRARQWR